MSLSVNILQLFHLSQDVLRGYANNKKKKNEALDPTGT